MESFNSFEFLKLHIPGPVPSKKNSKKIFRANNNKTYVVSSDFYRNWETEQLDNFYNDKRLKAIKKHLPIIKCTIQLSFVPWDKRKWDLTNKAESIMDLLVKAGILKDDNYEVVRTLQINYIEDNNYFPNPGCYVVINDFD